MRIFKQVSYAGAALIIALGMQLVPLQGVVVGEANAKEYAKPKRAYEAGIRQYQAGDLGAAIKALEYAAGKGHFRSKYYLARIYATNSNPYTNHARSFQLYQEIVDQFAEVDRVYNLRAAYVARAIVQVAHYWKTGIPALGMEPDPARAVSYLDHAAKYFDDQEAQYELAKMYLTGDGIPANAARGKHWLSTLSRAGHAEAQAYLGDLYWRGKYIGKNRIQGMAYVMLALGNAQPHNRVWIEELYQNIYCQSSAKMRREAALVASNLRKIGPRGKAATAGGRMALGLAEFRTTRTCRNGEQVALPKIPLSHGYRPAGDGSMLGATSGGFGLRSVGATD